MAVLTVPTLAVGLALGLLMAAAWYDLALRVIPDRFCLALAILGVAFRLHAGLIDLALSAMAALLLFFLLFIVFVRGIIGGGDVKLTVALALWFSWPDCYIFLMTTALVGGVLALVHLVLRRILALSAQPVSGVGGMGPRIIRIELQRIRAGRPLPYGLALALGGGYTLLRTLGG